MVAAFLDMDRRQSIAEAAVTASRELEPERNVDRTWTPIREACYRAAETYLQLARTEPDQPLATAAAYEHATTMIGSATRTLDEFYGYNRAHFEHAMSVAAAVPHIAQRARADAHSATRNLHAPDNAAFAGYRSVQTAADALDTALSALDAAVGTVAMRESAARVGQAAAELQAALELAPAQSDRARNTVSSVTTRIAAAHTRSAGLTPAYSALLREFNAASSADLAGNDRQATELLAHAEDSLTAARSELSAGRPEHALDHAAAARSHITVAERNIDAVTDRLATLRAVRENPAAKVDAVRFRLRDAQHLAVQRGMTAQWGSVLDAQLARIDRAVDSLTGVHPDYWAFVCDLDAVTDFITGVVQRMRGRTDGP
ncbi:MAG: hypothetical protein WAX14_19670 [Rhodococcus sp. (in: high G+C Gram-positive bacteria)]|uniref:hypothetical protein n=1 Tax=Rhodococcus sp. TaxID=1831 RepID=UPI003BB6F3B0